MNCGNFSQARGVRRIPSPILFPPTLVVWPDFYFPVLGFKKDVENNGVVLPYRHGHHLWLGGHSLD